MRPSIDEIDIGRLPSCVAPVVRLTDRILADSLEWGASDIHIEPYEKKFRVRFRVDGILHDVMGLPLALRDPITRRIKVMARLNITEERLPQDGRFEVRMKTGDRRRDLDFRVSVQPTLWGETIVMRLRDRSKAPMRLDELGFEPSSLGRFRAALSRRHGIVLATGPRRSGKTHLLYSATATLGSPHANIMTAEDQVELDLPGANQVEVDRRLGESVASVLRSFRHADADIVLVSEIRDPETAAVVFGLPERGPFVLSTLHSSDAPTAVARLLHMGIDPCRLATTVDTIVAQRLVRRICSGCRSDAAAEVPSKTLIDLGFAPGEKGAFPVMGGRGCPNCNGSGYKGRAGLFEVMEVTDGIRDLILAGATAGAIERRALEEGMLTLRMSGLEKIKCGVTTVEEVLRETVR
jgi:type IV pilus assembly protein PilB